MKYFIICTLFICSSSLFAQQDSTDYIDIGAGYDDRQIETFQQKKFHNGGYASLDFRYGQIENENALFAGGKVAYIMNRTLEVGLAGMGFITEQKNAAFEGNTLALGGGYGGLHLAAVIQPIKKVHFSIPVLLGAGAIGYDDEISGTQGRPIQVDDWDEIFVAQVGANVVFNVTSFFQAEIGVHYLHTTEIELEHVPGLEINGLNGGFSLRFGRF